MQLKHLKFTTTKVQTVPGTTTNLYHQTSTLQQNTTYILYYFFENGTIHWRTEPKLFDRDGFLNSVLQQFNESLQQLGENQEKHRNTILKLSGSKCIFLLHFRIY